MTPMLRSRDPRLAFGLRIVLPTVLAIGLFATAIFAIFVPAYERQIMDRKREMTRELTHSALSILEEYAREERAGALTRAQAQHEAVTRLRFLRYGEDGKDYFWITDLTPRMVMHPYRTELEGVDLRAFADPSGKKLFVEMVEATRAGGEGFVEYVWQWKDDPQRIVPKLSHVRAFEPWGWVVGTGIYLEDVRQEIRRLAGHLTQVSLIITGLLVLLLLWTLHESAGIERDRTRAVASLRDSRERYRALVEASTEGVALVMDGRIAFLNPALFELLGRRPEEVEGRGVPEGLGLEPGVELGPNPREVRLSRGDGRPVEAVASSTPIALGGGGGQIVTVRELAPSERAHKDREELSVELRVALQFLQEPVANLFRSPVLVSPEESIRRAAERMRRGETSAVLVGSAGGEAVGIITDRDLRDRVVAAGLDPSLPAHRIMSAPLASFPATGLAGEALQLMLERGVRHLAVRDTAGRVVGLLRDRELTATQRLSPASVTREIRTARSPEEIAELHGRVPRLVTALIETGSAPRTLNRVLSAVSQVTQERLIGLALEELGPPPVAFAFVSLGSDGREEQTLATDQDNALIWADPGEDARAEAEVYFLRLGERVCGDLDRAGYAACPGGIMARNPRWNQPLPAWIGMYRRWMEHPEPQEILQFSIFFDFRLVCGEAALTQALRREIAAILGSNPPFLAHLARHTSEFRLPVSAFGRIVTDSGGDGERTFNLKEAMAPIVHVARLFALRHGVEATNTLERLQRLHERGVLKNPDFEETVQVYEYLMRLRLRWQGQLLRSGRAPDNHLPMSELTDLDRALLRQAAGRVALLLKRVGYEFPGSA